MSKVRAVEMKTAKDEKSLIILLNIFITDWAVVFVILKTFCLLNLYYPFIAFLLSWSLFIIISYLFTVDTDF